MPYDIMELYPFVRSIAVKYYRLFSSGSLNSNAGFDVNDLVHEGMLALHQLNEKGEFDESRGTTFKQYATLRIRGAIIDYLRKSSLIRIPLKKINLYKGYVKQKEALTNQLKRPPDDNEMAQALQVSLEDVHEIKMLIPCIIEFEQTNIQSDFLTNDEVRHQFALDFEACKEKLSTEQFLVLISRLKEVTLEKLAASMNVSTETVRRREIEGRNKMIDCLKGKEWHIDDTL